MEKVKAFCKRKNIEISVKRYLIDALGAMAGIICIAFDRNDHQYTWNTVKYSDS